MPRCGNQRILGPVMRGGCAVAIGMCLATAPACGEGDGPPGVDGELGQPIAASFASDVPSVSASLAGEAAAPFLLDTGAPITLADTEDSDLEPG